MATLKSEFLRTLSERGYIHQCTDLENLDRLTAANSIVAYVGYDCTADSLHIGHLVSIMMLRWLQRTGHRPIALMGGGTTKVGDPSGRDETRKLLNDEDIARNMASIKRTFASFLSFGDGPADAIMVNNADWLDGLKYIPFLREYGRHFSVNRMLSFDSVRLRLDREQPLSFLEFNYMILQAYDFVELARRYDCVLQMGGSDQWGNIVNGVDLARRVREFSSREAAGGQESGLYGLTSPLIMTASGQKMGKSLGGAVWLNPDRLSPYEYWQFWRNTEDADVGRFLKLFTELPLHEIERLEHLRDSEINEAKKVLATEATALLHGRSAAADAAETARTTFEERGAGEALPVVEIARDELEAGVPVFVALVRAGLAASNGEARRLIRGGGARVNDQPTKSETQSLSLADANAGGMIKLSAGKKRHALVRPA